VAQPGKKPLPPPKPLGLGKRNLRLVRPEGVDTLGAGEDERRLRDGSRSSPRSDLVIAAEKFSAIAHELPPLFQRHWEELAVNRDAIPLDPDWERYFGLEMQGMLHITTARADGVLAGYIFNLVGPHLHYKSSIHCQIEMFWLDPIYRGGWFPVRWFRENERLIKAAGTKRVHVAVKNHYMTGRVSSIFRRLGYLPIETTWSRML